MYIHVILRADADRVVLTCTTPDSLMHRGSKRQDAFDVDCFIQYKYKLNNTNAMREVRLDPHFVPSTTGSYLVCDRHIGAGLPAVDAVPIEGVMRAKGQGERTEDKPSTE